MGLRFLAFILLLAFIPCAFAEKTDAGKPPYLKKSTAPSSDKMDKVLLGQEEILKQLEEIKNELYVIKIRATK